MITIKHNLASALHLFEMIDKYIPDNYPGDASKYLEVIITNIKNGGHVTDYIDIVQFVSGVERDTLMNSSAMEVFEAFTSGLVEWDVINLVKFFRLVGYHGRRSG